MPTHAFKELRDEFTSDPDQAVLLAKVKKDRQAEQAAYERDLTAVRRARAYTQEQLARSLAVSQAQVARIEQQTNLYLSTLQSYLAAMDGEFALVATFDDRRVVFAIEDLSADDALTESAEIQGNTQTPVAASV